MTKIPVKSADSNSLRAIQLKISNLEKKFKKLKVEWDQCKEKQAAEHYLNASLQ